MIYKKNSTLFCFVFCVNRPEVDMLDPRRDRLLSKFVLHGTVLITNFSVIHLKCQNLHMLNLVLWYMSWEPEFRLSGWNYSMPVLHENDWVIHFIQLHVFTFWLNLAGIHLNALHDQSLGLSHNQPVNSAKCTCVFLSLSCILPVSCFHHSLLGLNS